MRREAWTTRVANARPARMRGIVKSDMSRSVPYALLDETLFPVVVSGRWAPENPRQENEAVCDMCMYRHRDRASHGWTDPLTMTGERFTFQFDCLPRPGLLCQPPGPQSMKRVERCKGESDMNYDTDALLNSHKEIIMLKSLLRCPCSSSITVSRVDSLVDWITLSFCVSKLEGKAQPDQCRRARHPTDKGAYSAPTYSQLHSTVSFTRLMYAFLSSLCRFAASAFAGELMLGSLSSD